MERLSYEMTHEAQSSVFADSSSPTPPNGARRRHCRMEGAVCVLVRLVDRRFARGWVSVAVLVVLCAMAGPAAASTAKLVDVVLPPYCKYNPPGVPCLPGSAPVVVYQAGPGEPNRVSLTGGREEVRISDPAAVISPGAGWLRIDRSGCWWSGGVARWTGVFVGKR